MAFLLLLCLCVMTNFMSNFASALVVMPVAIPLCSSSPLAMSIVTFGICAVMFEAYALPSANIPASIIHGQKDLNKSSVLIPYGFGISVFLYLITFAVTAVFSFILM